MRTTIGFYAAAIAVFLCGVCFSQAQAQQAGEVLISEFRLAGEAGAQDEFIELYNNTDSDITVAASDASAGWAVAVSFGSIRGVLFVIPNGTMIPARGHFLGGNINEYSLSNYPSGNPGAGGPSPFAPTTPNGTWDFDIPETDQSVGLALFTTTNNPAQSAANRLDAVGLPGANALFREGPGFDRVPGNGTVFRDLRTSRGTPKDTNDNAADFLLLSTNAAVAPTGGTILGAPGPENLNSPVTGVYPISVALVDPTVTSNGAPNRERRPNVEPNANLGVLLIRRRITNQSGQPISRLRFRVIEITGPGTDNTCGGSPCADLRVLTSQDGETGSPNIGVVPVRGLTLEQPPPQPSGGGLNSSVSDDSVTLATPIAPGSSIHVGFKLGVMRSGSFRFLINIEAQPSPPSTSGRAPELPKQNNKGRVSK